ncbi:MAG: hypothetical protein ACRC4W_03160 [Treponemataceae bacterium]
MVAVKNIAKKKDSHYTQLKNAFLPIESLVSFDQDSDDYMVLIKKEQIISEGQIIATGKNTGCNLHSPIPGKVIDIISEVMPNGKKSLCAKIKLQGRFSHTGKINKQVVSDFLSSDQIIRYLADKGTINTFEDPTPLSQQLEEARNLSKKNLIVRLYDDDPTCAIDLFLAKNYFTQIIKGAFIVARAFLADAIYFMFSPQSLGSKPEKMIQESGEKYSIPFFFLPVDISFYPCGGKREIVEMLQKMKDYPAHITDIAIDSATALCAYEAVCLDKPLMERYIQVSGDAILKPQILKAKIGTSIGGLLLESGGILNKKAKIVINGLIKGTVINNFNTPITKYVKSLTINKLTFYNHNTTSCIACGQCHQICPAGLHPDEIYTIFSNSEQAYNEEYFDSAAFCYKCRLCNTVCPSRLPLFQAINHVANQKNEEKNES